MLRDYIVYKHTCPNGEIYIGITNQDPKNRWLDGEGYKGQWFYNAIKEFGWNSIKHEIVMKDLTKIEAVKIETELIIQYSSWAPGRGYNDNLGEGYHKTLPIRDLETNKVYLSVKYCSKDLNISESKIRSSIEGRGSLAYRFEYCSSDNVSDKDIYIIDGIEHTINSNINIDSFLNIFNNNYLCIEKKDKGILSYEEGIECDRLGLPKLDGIVWNITNCRNSEDFLLKILNDYLEENKKQSDGIVFFDIMTKKFLNIICKEYEIFTAFKILINKYNAKNIVEIGYDRFSSHTFGVYVVKLNFNVENFKEGFYFVDVNNQDFCFENMK